METCRHPHTWWITSCNGGKQDNMSQLLGHNNLIATLCNNKGGCCVCTVWRETASNQRQIIQFYESNWSKCKQKGLEKKTFCVDCFDWNLDYIRFVV